MPCKRLLTDLLLLEAGRFSLLPQRREDRTASWQEASATSKNKQQWQNLLAQGPGGLQEADTFGRGQKWPEEGKDTNLAPDAIKIKEAGITGAARQGRRGHMRALRSSETRT